MFALPTKMTPSLHARRSAVIEASAKKRKRQQKVRAQTYTRELESVMRCRCGATCVIGHGSPLLQLHPPERDNPTLSWPACLHGLPRSRRNGLLLDTTEGTGPFGCEPPCFFPVELPLELVASLEFKGTVADLSFRGGSCGFNRGSAIIGDKAVPISCPMICSWRPVGSFLQPTAEVYCEISREVDS